MSLICLDVIGLFINESLVIMGLIEHLACNNKNCIHYEEVLEENTFLSQGRER